MSILRSSLTRAAAWLARSALGEACLLCGAEGAGSPLCVPCRSDLPALAAGCPVCAIPGEPGSVCGTCLAHPPRFDATVALWPYAYPVDRLVQALKFRGELALAPFFAREMAARAGPIDALLPLPLHPSRLAERGFNQAAEIARSLSAMTGTTLLAQDAVRIRATRAQAALPLDERSRNVRGAFRCTLDLEGARIAVIDDVMTSGATLDEFAGVLKRAGAARVENWVVARTLA